MAKNDWGGPDITVQELFEKFRELDERVSKLERHANRSKPIGGNSPEKIAAHLKEHGHPILKGDNHE